MSDSSSVPTTSVRLRSPPILHTTHSHPAADTSTPKVTIASSAAVTCRLGTIRSSAISVASPADVPRRADAQTPRRCSPAAKAARNTTRNTAATANNESRWPAVAGRSGDSGTKTASRTTAMRPPDVTSRAPSHPCHRRGTSSSGSSSSGRGRGRRTSSSGWSVVISAAPLRLVLVTSLKDHLGATRVEVTDDEHLGSAEIGPVGSLQGACAATVEEDLLPVPCEVCDATSDRALDRSCTRSPRDRIVVLPALADAFTWYSAPATRAHPMAAATSTTNTVRLLTTSLQTVQCRSVSSRVLSSRGSTEDRRANWQHHDLPRCSGARHCGPGGRGLRRGRTRRRSWPDPPDSVLHAARRAVVAAGERGSVPSLGSACLRAHLDGHRALPRFLVAGRSHDVPGPPEPRRPEPHGQKRQVDEAEQHPDLHQEPRVRQAASVVVLAAAPNRLVESVSDTCR